jgi:hypothetical protein
MSNLVADEKSDRSAKVLLDFLEEYLDEFRESDTSR